MTIIEFLFYISKILIDAKDFYNKELILRQRFLAFHLEPNESIEISKFEDKNNNSPRSEVDYVVSYLNEMLSYSQELLNVVSDGCKSRLLRIQELLDKVTMIIKAHNHLAFNDLDSITKGLDEEDKIYIQQTMTQPAEVKIRSKLRIRNTNELATTYLSYDVEDLIGVLRQIGKNWNFDMFFLKECTDNRPLVTVGKYCVGKFRLDESLKIDLNIYQNFFHELEMRYKPNPYHNSTHAADVLSSMLYFINKSDLCKLLSEYDILASIIAALGHDVAHPGFTNRFLVINKDENALLCNFYVDNDFSVLEMMHCSVTFQIMKSDDSNILITLDSEHYIAVRKLIIELILATDMSKHWDLLAHFKAKSVTIPKNFESFEQRSDTLKILIKAADVSHAAKSIDLHQR